jgi:ATP synthase protein I
MAEPRQTKTPPDPELGNISDRLKDLGSRISAEQSERIETQKPAISIGKAADFSKGYKLASEFVAGVLVGGLIGYGLDYLLGTLPWLLILFTLLGFGAGLINMSRAAKRDQLSPEELAKLKPAPADDDEED